MEKLTVLFFKGGGKLLNVLNQFWILFRLLNDLDMFTLGRFQATFMVEEDNVVHIKKDLWNILYFNPFPISNAEDNSNYHWVIMMWQMHARVHNEYIFNLSTTTWKQVFRYSFHRRGMQSSKRLLTWQWKESRAEFTSTCSWAQSLIHYSGRKQFSLVEPHTKYSTYSLNWKRY